MVTRPVRDTESTASTAATGQVLREHDLPLMLLHDEALRANIDLMARYCADRGVHLAPHAKTSMASYISRLQADAGIWGLTVATVRQARNVANLGHKRTFLANVLVEPQGIGWVADTYLRDGSTGEFLCYVDSISGVELLEARLDELDTARPLDVVVELGYRGGRTGARGLKSALQVADRAAASHQLRLRGVAGFEGLMRRQGELVPPGLPAYLAELRELAVQLHRRSLLTAHPVVSAGGSAYFDLVADHLDTAALGFAAQTVLRSGCYVTHDHGTYRVTSPLDGRGRGGPRLRPALELVAAVWSRPEPGLVIAGFGRREAPTDDGLPVLLGTLDPTDGSKEEAVGLVREVNDHHAFLEVPAASSMRPGDLLSFGICHPCGAFDRWRSVPVVDQAYRQLSVLMPQL